MMNQGIQRLEKYGLSLYMIRITLAASLSWVAVHALYGDRYFFFAPLAAILITQGSVKASLEKGAYRLLGIILGGIVSLIIGRFFDMSGLSILLMLLLGIGVATACRINMQAVTQIGVTSILALTYYHDQYIIWRIAETFIGVAIALGVNMIVVPPHSFAKAKQSVLKASLLLAESLRSFSNGPQTTADTAHDALKQAGKLLKQSVQEQKDLHYTLSHYHCRHELKQLTTATLHLKVIHGFVRQTEDVLNHLKRDDTLDSCWSPAAQMTAECIVMYGQRGLSPSEGYNANLAEVVHNAREAQLSSFSELQSSASLTTVRDLGAVFSHLNRLLEEIENANRAGLLPERVKAKSDVRHAIRFMKKGLSHKL